MRTAFGMVLVRSVAETGDTARGFDWLRRLDAQTKEYAVNPALLFEKLTRQEGLVSIWELTDMLFLRQRGAPLGYAFPASGTPVIDDAIGLVAGAPARRAGAALHRLGGQPRGAAARRRARLPAAGAHRHAARGAAGVGASRRSTRSSGWTWTGSCWPSAAPSGCRAGTAKCGVAAEPPARSADL